MDSATTTIDAGPQDADTADAGPCEPPSGGVYLGNFQGLVTYFQQLAQLDALVIPAHGVDCTPSGVDAGACFYNPLLSQLDASDIHYSNADRGFVGPDGHPYVWVLLPDWNAYHLINADRCARPISSASNTTSATCPGPPLRRGGGLMPRRRRDAAPVE